MLEKIKGILTKEDTKTKVLKVLGVLATAGTLASLITKPANDRKTCEKYCEEYLNKRNG